MVVQGSGILVGGLRGNASGHQRHPRETVLLVRSDSSQLSDFPTSTRSVLPGELLWPVPAGGAVPAEHAVSCVPLEAARYAVVAP